MRFILRGLIFLSFILAAATTVLMPAELDETWILLTLEQLAIGKELVPGLALVTTSGGVYSLYQSCVFWFIGPSLTAARLGSFLSLLVLSALVWKISRWEEKKPNSLGVSLALVLLLAAPGTLVFSGMAYANVMATALILLGFYLWACGEGESRWIGGGVFIGLSCATRLNCLVAIPSLFLFALMSRDKKDRLMTLKTCFCAGAVFVCAWGTLVLLSSDSYHLLKQNAEATGFLHVAKGEYASFLTYLSRLWMTDALFPLSLSILALALSLLPLWGEDASMQRLCTLCSLSACLMLLLFLFMAPYGFLRYYWPSIALTSCVLGWQLERVCALAQSKSQRFLLSTAFALYLCVGMAQATFAVSVGHWRPDLAWHASSFSSPPFARLRELQRGVQALSQRLPEDAVIGAVFNVREHAFLAQRSVLLPWDWMERGKPVDYVLSRTLFPVEDASTREWMEQNCTLWLEEGDLLIYKVIPNAAKKLDK